MWWLLLFPILLTCGLAQAADTRLEIPPLKTSVDLDGKPLHFTVWGDLDLRGPTLRATVDLSDLQANLTPILAPHIERSEHCGERLELQRTTLAPHDADALLTAYVHVERYGCVKAFGKQMVKRLVGGNGVIEVLLKPAITPDGIHLNAEVRGMQADGSLGDVLNSGQFGDRLREKIAASVERALQRSANLKAALPAEIDQALSLRAVHFADGRDGHLWLSIDADVHLTPDQLRALPIAATKPPPNRP